MVFPGGALGINLMMLDLWQLVLGGFWNLILGIQAYDRLRTSFWSLSIVKKWSKIAPKENPQSHRLNCLPVSFAPMLVPSSYFQVSQLINRSRWSCSGNFKLVALIFNWSRSPSENHIRIKIPFEGFILILKTDWLGTVYYSRPWRWFHFLISTLHLKFWCGYQGKAS